MTKLEEQVLNSFCILEIILGIWMVSSPINTENIIRILELYSPLWILGVIFIIGGCIKLFTRKKYISLYVALVSIPLTFFGLIWLQFVLTYNVFTINVIVFNFLGLYSAIYAGQVFPKFKKAPG